jgi:hypothetical protein
VQVATCASAPSRQGSRLDVFSEHPLARKRRQGQSGHQPRAMGLKKRRRISGRNCVTISTQISVCDTIFEQRFAE